MKKKFWLVALMAVMAFALTACGGGDDEKTSDGNADKPAVKVGFVYSAPVGDEGFVDMHNNARLKLEEEFNIETAYVENVLDSNAAESEKAMRQLIDQGCNVIYACSFGYMDAVLTLAEEFPDVKFGHATGYTTTENVSTYFGRVYEERYLSGIVAGMQTESNKIGFVAAMAIPEVLRSIDAFTLGVQSVNPDATVEVVWVGEWYEPSKEKTAALELINKGCDVIAQHTNSTAPLLAAQEKGVYGIGYNAVYSDTFKDAYLTTPYINWYAFYQDDVKAVIDGTWKSRSYWGGIDTGMVNMDDLSDNCKDKEAMQKAIDEAKEKIVSGDLFVFTGPLKDNEGNEKVADGVKMTDEEMLAIDWLVEGVIGSPK